MNAIKSIASVAAVALLAGCSSLSMPTAAKLRALDYLNDDIGSLVLAFDVPETLEPINGESEFALAIAIAGQGERRVVARLVPGDGSDVAGTLPPPADERTYYLLGFSDADKGRIREVQAWAKGIAQTGVAPNTPVISIAPRFCQTDVIDPANTRVSVLIALPGSAALDPLVRNESVASLLASTGAGSVLPNCAGHSG